MIRENNADLGKTFVYSYDANGNILSKKEYAYTIGLIGEVLATTTYSYDEYDKLVAINGVAISYNAGSPTTYAGKSFEWQDGKLKKCTTSNGIVEYSRNSSGVIIIKTVQSGRQKTNHFYYHSGNKLIFEDIGASTKINYLYNAQGVMGLQYNGCAYTYRKNLFGDITEIYSGTTCVAKYKYDAWGNCTVCNPDGTVNTSADFIGNINPFRYRGYYWDRDLQLYHLQTRYYDPTVGRFISPDSYEYLDPESFGGLNLYCYCLNNPVNYKQRPVSSGSSITISSISSSGLAGNRISGNAVKPISKTLSSKSSGFNLFGYELRTSAGWATSPDIATSFFGRIGFSSYVTHTQGQSGMLYAFAGSTSDVMNWFGTTYYAGLGINLFDILGVEAHLETVGIGAQVSIGRFSIGADINLIGGTSITLGWNTDLGNGMTKTDGFIVGVNTGYLVAVICWIYKFVTTGDPSPVPVLQTVY